MWRTSRKYTQELKRNEHGSDSVAPPPIRITAPDPTPPAFAFTPQPPAQRNKKPLEGLVFDIQWRKQEPKESFFACVDRIYVCHTVDLDFLTDL